MHFEGIAFTNFATRPFCAPGESRTPNALRRRFLRPLCLPVPSPEHEQKLKGFLTRYTNQPSYYNKCYNPFGRADALLIHSAFGARIPYVYPKFDAAGEGFEPSIATLTEWGITALLSYNAVTGSGQPDLRRNLSCLINYSGNIQRPNASSWDRTNNLRHDDFHPIGTLLCH